MYLWKMSLGVVFHPVDTFMGIKKDRSRINYLPSLILLLAVVIVRIVSIFAGHFPLAQVQPRNANIFLEAVRMLLPLLTWVLGCYALTTIMDGETLLRETLEAAAFSMLPYILFTVPLALLSNILQKSENSFYTGLHIALWIWIIALFIINVKVMNEYSFIKTIWILLLSIISVVLIWVISMLTYALTTQLYRFFAGVVLEIKLLLMK